MSDKRNKWVKCEDCGRKFSSVKLLHDHVKEIHRIRHSKPKPSKHPIKIINPKFHRASNNWDNIGAL